MSFWGKLGGALKGIGKFALKAAPVAAAFIPGIGPLAAMGIGAATNAASKKISGGSWGDALKSGAIGGAMGGLGAAVKGGGLLQKLGSKLGIGGAQNAVMGRINAGNQGMMNAVNGMNPSPDMLQRILGGMRGFGGNMRAMPQQQQRYSPYRTPPFFPQNSGITGGMNLGFPAPQASGIGPSVGYGRNERSQYGPM